MTEIAERLGRLRDSFPGLGIDLYLVPSADEHVNEYLPPWRERRRWASGFTGSAGDLLVGRDQAWLFVDGRYHLQADQELEGSGIAAVKMGAEGHLPLPAFLSELARQGEPPTLGFDPFQIPLAMHDALDASGLPLREVEGNLVDAVWSNRPAPAEGPLQEVPEAWSGSRPDRKLAALRAELAKADAEAVVAVKLDQIAWLLDLRSNEDVPYNPVFESFAWIDNEALHLFVREPGRRLPAGFESSLPGLVIHGYDEFPRFLGEQGGAKKRVLIDPTGATRGVVAALEQAGVEIVRGDSPLETLKAHKNEVEREAMRRANLSASLVKTRTLLWLRREIAAGHTVTEASFRDRLESYYAEQPDFAGLSFTTISGTGPNGAIIHYGAAGEHPLQSGHLFLVDSGAHLAGGTTDDTRTLAIGTPDAEQQRVYTAVLRGHIRAASQRIPSGTPGHALDTLARTALWQEGLDYAHGTGHGVGAFLNVHEGPFSISSGRPASGRALEHGIVASIEPGYYRPGWGGVRLENLYLFLEDERNEENGRRWLHLESLTWIPFDPALIDRAVLSPAEASWLDDYQNECLRRLEPMLEPAEREELAAWIAPPTIDT